MAVTAALSPSSFPQSSIGRCRALPADREIVLGSGAVPAVGRHDESVHRIPDRKGSRWGPSVPFGPAVGASLAPQRCRRDAVAVRNDSTRSDSFWLLLDFEIDEIAILGELAN